MPKYVRRKLLIENRNRKENQVGEKDNIFQKMSLTTTDGELLAEKIKEGKRCRH